MLRIVLGACRTSEAVHGARVEDACIGEKRLRWLGAVPLVSKLQRPGHITEEAGSSCFV
jgi:hypothetical protein